MLENSSLFIFLVPIAALFGVALLSASAQRLPLLMNIAKLAPVLGITASFIGLTFLIQNPLIETSTLGIKELGFSLRIDPLSLIMYAMVSIIALVVVRFSINYLDGDPNQHKFMAKLAITIAFVQLLVLSGNIFMLFVMWVATSIALHQLLIFYPNRFKARIAARKKFILARLGDATLLVAFILLYSTFNTGNLNLIFNQIQNLPLAEVSTQLEIATLLLVLTAGLKSVQLPFHGWILEVMETPTPVSALLHAGLLNAGPFLMIRFAYLLDVVSLAPVALFLMGACTALYGALVFTTQPTIKTALAYSSIGHMGFTLMLSGLGLYAASLLHLVAHSIYKAHAFLSSGSVVDNVQTNKAASSIRQGNLAKISVAFICSAFIYTSIALIWSRFVELPIQLLLVGGILFTGILSLIIHTLDATNNWMAIIKLLISACLVVISFFTLEEVMRIALGNQIPFIKEPTTLILYLMSVTLGIFFMLAAWRAIMPFIRTKKTATKLGVHIRNGFYLNVLFDRLISSLNYKN